MKKFLMFTVVSLFLLAVTIGTSHDVLIDRGTGMIYDSDQNITWLQDANYAQTSGHDSDGKMGWDQAMNWAKQLEYGGYDDWRLPKSGGTRTRNMASFRHRLDRPSRIKAEKIIQEILGYRSNSFQIKQGRMTLLFYLEYLHTTGFSYFSKLHMGIPYSRLRICHFSVRPPV